jgi:hypothetical protein
MKQRIYNSDNTHYAELDPDNLTENKVIDLNNIGGDGSFAGLFLEEDGVKL